MADDVAEQVEGATETPEIEWPQVAPVWHVETAMGAVEAKSALAVLREVDQAVQQGRLNQFEPIPTGFETLDRRLGGGLRPCELVLMGGSQGVGKTMMALQMARNIAAARKATCLYICFEHEENDLLQRLISQESIDPTGDAYQVGLKVRDLQSMAIDSYKHSAIGLVEELAADSRGEEALRKLSEYAHRLFLVRGSGVRTTLGAVHAMVKQHRAQGSERLVIFIDYLQKIPLYPEPPDEAEKVTRIVEALKELALSQEVAVVAIAAADKEGIKAKRLRLHHLRGSSALLYEADVILILNDKYRIVTKANIEFNPYKAQAYHDWVVCSIEKNRGARSDIDVEFRKRFEHSCYDPRGGDVQEQLIEERIYTE